MKNKFRKKEGFKKISENANKHPEISKEIIDTTIKSKSLKVIYNPYLKKLLLISFLMILFFLPKWLHPTITPTIMILENFVNIFLNYGVYIVISIFLINFVLVFLAINFLLNEDTKIGSRIILHKNRTFLRVFTGYFIFLFFLVSIFVQKSYEIQTKLGKDTNDIVYTLTVSSLIVVLLIVYLSRVEFSIGDSKVGPFILYLLGSTILFETLIGFSPLIALFRLLINPNIIENDLAILTIAPYYNSFLGSIILSIIDLRFFNSTILNKK